ncbi:MAG TPA: YitT family protein [Rhodocyclaceae bacterium]
MAESGRARAGTSPHTPFEDAQAIATGTLLFAVAVLVFGKSGILTGGTAGVTFLLHYASEVSFPVLYLLVNLPFYVFAKQALGWRFTIKTFAAVSLLALYVRLIPAWFVIDEIDPLFGAILGGLLGGAGLLMLMRHQASLGGLGVLAIWLQDRHGWRAGKVQMAVDCVIVSTAVLVIGVEAAVLSGLSALLLNLVLTINHKPGRYAGY